MVSALKGFCLGDRVEVVGSAGDIEFFSSLIGEQGTIVTFDTGDDSAVVVFPNFDGGFEMYESSSVDYGRIQEGLSSGWFLEGDIHRDCCSWISLTDLVIVRTKNKIQWIE